MSVCRSHRTIVIDKSRPEPRSRALTKIEVKRYTAFASTAISFTDITIKRDIPPPREDTHTKCKHNKSNDLRVFGWGQVYLEFFFCLCFFVVSRSRVSSNLICSLCGKSRAAHTADRYVCTKHRYVGSLMHLWWSKWVGGMSESCATNDATRISINGASTQIDGLI